MKQVEGGYGKLRPSTDVDGILSIPERFRARLLSASGEPLTGGGLGPNAFDAWMPSRPAETWPVWPAATGMAVTDYPLYFAIRDNFRFGGKLAALDGAGIAGSDGPDALTFVQNHDVGPPMNRLLAYAFIAAYPGYPAFFDVDLNDSAINNLVWIQNTLAAGPYVNRYKDADTIIFSRGDRLLAGVNQQGSWVNKWVQTPWVNTQIHDYTGHVQDERTNQDGWVELWLPPQGYIMMAPLR